MVAHGTYFNETGLEQDRTSTNTVNSSDQTRTSLTKYGLVLNYTYTEIELKRYINNTYFTNGGILGNKGIENYKA